MTHNIKKTFGTTDIVITENEKTYTFELSVPGYTMDQLKVGIKPTELRISADPVKDVAQGQFTKGFTNVYPIDVENPDMAPATTEGRSITLLNGVLTMVIPKDASVVAETLEITAG
ncbi:Hsp20/alpha crystallin family protein [Candidatus Pacearchaeota archaeon]|nr:Hsp20/alpha crystallin family protein [Candidatus Pacearchaeota archaeon]